MHLIFQKLFVSLLTSIVLFQNYLHQIKHEENTFFQASNLIQSFKKKSYRTWSDPLQKEFVLG